MLQPDHDIFFVHGTGGSFIDTIFLFYFYLSHKQYTIRELQEKFLLIGKMGECHDATQSPHYHTVSDLEFYNPNKKNIAIRYTQDDEQFILDMAYNKLFLQESHTTDKFLSNFKLNKKMLKNKKTLEDTIKKLCQKNVTHWRENFDFSKINLLIDFNTIYGRNKENLHDIIGDFLKIEKLPIIDDYIKFYQNKNSKYFII